MHKILILFGSLIITTQVYCQENTVSDQILSGKNEIKINGLFLILGAIEVNYEYLVNDETGLGIDVLVVLDNENTDFNYYVSPYYRQYFGKKPAAGFFVEGFGMLNSVKDFVFETTTNAEGLTSTIFNNRIENVTDFALGISVGAKFLTKRGFVAQFNLGAGRNLFRNDRNLTIIGKIGISLGYRF